MDNKRRKIAVVLCTRGMVFTKVMASLEKERETNDFKIYYSDHLPIPDAQNLTVEAALIDGATDIWFVEEDTVPPTGSLESLLQSGSNIACVDYGVSGWGCVTKNPEGEILWCGLGCTLIRREVFEKVDKPWFRVDKVLRLNDWTWQQLPESYIQKKHYGTLDIWFFSRAREKGFKITQMPGEAEHLQLDSLGVRGVNNGLHGISQRPRIEKHQVVDNTLEKEVTF